jgi:hypothetical protein
MTTVKTPTPAESKLCHHPELRRMLDVGATFGNLSVCRRVVRGWLELTAEQLKAVHRTQPRGTTSLHL